VTSTEAFCCTTLAINDKKDHREDDENNYPNLVVSHCYFLSTFDKIETSFYDFITLHTLHTFTQMLDSEGYVLVDFLHPILRGLHYIPNIVPRDLESETMKFFEDDSDAKWFSVGSGEKSRQVMHFGYAYNYRTGSVTEPTVSFPSTIKKYVKILHKLNILPKNQKLQQCIINRYEPGQGIGAHIDNNDYGDYVCCFTLGSGATMTFTREDDTVDVYTQPNSLYIMSGPSRSEWKHEMKGRKNDIIDGMRVARGIRYSVTFRTVINV